MSTEHHDQTSNADPPHERGPWNAALNTLREWDPVWAGGCAKMSTNPWMTGILPRKLVELIGVAVNAACTNLNPDGTRRHIRAALNAGASRDEILMVLKMASLLSIHSCSLGAPILLEEAKAAAAQSAGTTALHAGLRQDPGARPMERGVEPVFRT